jgi:hypothetical protein
MLLLDLENPLFEQHVFKTKSFILLFEPLCDVLQLNGALNFALFI